VQPITALRFGSRTTPRRKREQFEDDYSGTFGSRNDVADADIGARFLDTAAVHANMPGLRPTLRQRPALGKAQEEQELVDAQCSQPLPNLPCKAAS
jgi:hypothetical protein